MSPNTLFQQDNERLLHKETLEGVGKVQTNTSAKCGWKTCLVTLALVWKHTSWQKRNQNAGCKKPLRICNPPPQKKNRGAVPGKHSAIRPRQDRTCESFLSPVASSCCAYPNCWSPKLRGAKRWRIPTLFKSSEMLEPKSHWVTPQRWIRLVKARFKTCQRKAEWISSWHLSSSLQATVSWQAPVLKVNNETHLLQDFVKGLSFNDIV